VAHQNFVEMRFLKGENRRFFGAREAAKKNGYPDVATYLRSTGQVNEWCEEVPQELVEVSLKAEECRALCKQASQSPCTL